MTGKLPPMAAKNGLKIHPQDPELELTELEGNLIAKRIVFMKIFQLPKTRWTALKDKVINIPVNEDDIFNIITSLPRTPNEEEGGVQKLTLETTHQPRKSLQNA